MILSSYFINGCHRWMTKRGGEVHLLESELWVYVKTRKVFFPVVTFHSFLPSVSRRSNVAEEKWAGSALSRDIFFVRDFRTLLTVIRSSLSHGDTRIIPRNLRFRNRRTLNHYIGASPGFFYKCDGLHGFSVRLTNCRPQLPTYLNPSTVLDHPLQTTVIVPLQFQP